MCYKSPLVEDAKSSRSPDGMGLQVSSRDATILARRPTMGAIGPQLWIVASLRILGRPFFAGFFTLSFTTSSCATKSESEPILHAESGLRCCF